MAFGRYENNPKIDAGKQFGTQAHMRVIYIKCNNGTLPTSVRYAKAGERLDTIAGRVYGDSRYWWVISAASGIGWNLQVPPGTRIVIPQNISDIEALVT